MFDSVGRHGRVKKLSPARWLISWIITALIMSGVFFAGDMLKDAPTAEAQVEEEPEDVTFKQSLPPPPPPPPPPAARPPRSTTRPKKPVITKKVIKQEIKDPDPTPLPPKDEDKEGTPTPEPELDFDGLEGAEGGVVGGVLGGVIGGQIGSNTYGSGNIQEVDVNDIQRIIVVNPTYPALAKRGRIEGSVMIEVTCAPDGSVAHITWLSGNVIFKDSVLTAVKKWKYAPRPISFKFRQPLNFSLKQ